MNVRDLHHRLSRLIIDGCGDHQVLVVVHTSDERLQAAVDDHAWIAYRVHVAQSPDGRFVVIAAEQEPDERCDACGRLIDHTDHCPEREKL